MAIITSCASPAVSSPPAQPIPVPQTAVPSQGTKSAESVVVPSQNASQPVAQPAPKPIKRPVVASTPIPSRTPGIKEPVGRIDWFKDPKGLTTSSTLFLVAGAIVADDVTGIGIANDPIALVFVGAACIAVVYENSPQMQNAMKMTQQQILAWAATLSVTTVAIASEEMIMQATAKQLFPPIEGKWKESRTPLLPPSVDVNHMKSGDQQRVLERFIALAAAWQLANTKPPECWHRKGGGTLQLPTGKVEEIQEAITLFWDGVTCKIKGCDTMKGVGFLGQIGQPHLSTSFGNKGILRVTYSTGAPVWTPISQDDARCKWTLSLLDMFYNALRGEGNGFPPNLPPLLPQ